jgi:hypothetical protein
MLPHPHGVGEGYKMLLKRIIACKTICFSEFPTTRGQPCSRCRDCRQIALRESTGGLTLSRTLH